MRVISFDEVCKMIALDGQTLSALTFLSGAISEFRTQLQLLHAGHIKPLDHAISTRAQFIKALKTLGKAAVQMDMPGVARGLNRSTEECLELLASPIGNDAHRLSKIIGHGERAVLNFMDELEGKTLFTLSPRHAVYISLIHPFGEEVADAFPSAAYDILEASRCRSLERWTATVMHIMRVLEVGLGALAAHYGIEAGQNWNSTLNQIETKSREVGKKSHGAEKEQWAAEAAVHLRFIKNAWRNHAMHRLEKYDEERAVAIFDNARAFMMHLAQALEESDDLADDGL